MTFFRFFPFPNFLDTLPSRLLPKQAVVINIFPLSSFGSDGIQATTTSTTMMLLHSGILKGECRRGRPRCLLLCNRLSTRDACHVVTIEDDC